MTETTGLAVEPGIPQLKGSRTFDAPPELVFRAWTEPELVVQWLGPRRLKMRIEEWDARHGGRWRYIHIDEDGSEYGFRGVFHGTPSVDGIVQTFEFEGAPGHVQLDTVSFERVGDTTLARFNTVFQTVEARDAMLEHGMEQGWTESLERLDELLASMKTNV
jgi:uncharacterized protein YndB with AHSA1/START domain